MYLCITKNAKAMIVFCKDNRLRWLFAILTLCFATMPLSAYAYMQSAVEVDTTDVIVTDTAVIFPESVTELEALSKEKGGER